MRRSASAAASRTTPARPQPQTEAARAVAHLLAGTGWDANDTGIRAALPNARAAYDGFDIADGLAALQIPLTRLHLPLSRLDAAEAPCLAVARDGGFLVIRGARPGKIEVVTDLDSGTTAWHRPPSGRFTLFIIAEPRDGNLAAQAEAAPPRIAELRANLAGLLFTSLAINLLGFATLLFVISVYDSEIPALSGETVLRLTIGLLIAVAAELAIRALRGRSMVQIAARLEYRLGLAFLNRLMIFPLDTQLRAGADQHLMRLRQFEGIRDALVGVLARVVLDVPFAFLFAALLFVLAPTVGWIALGAAAVHIGFSLAVAFALRDAETQATDDTTAYRAEVGEAVRMRDVVRHLGLMEARRARLMSAFMAMSDSTLDVQRRRRVAAATGQTLLTIGGIAAAFHATGLALREAITMGELIAIFVLVWRFLLPLQTLQAAAAQSLVMARSLQQAAEVLNLPGETYRYARPRTLTQIGPPVVFDQVVVRFPRTESAALFGVSLRIEPGEIVAVSGRAMAGKTVLLETLAGLHPLAAGRILVNGTDIRQIPVDDLRGGIAFAQQHPDFLFGTVAQNLRLAAPAATDADLWAALAELGLTETVERFPRGIDTRLTTEFLADLPAMVRQGLSLARMLLRDGPIFAVDQPTAGLDRARAGRVRQALQARRTRGTVIMATNDPADLQIATRFILLDHGRIVLSERGAAGMKKARALLRIDQSEAA